MAPVDFTPLVADNKKALEDRFLNEVGANFRKLIKANNLRVSFFSCPISDLYMVMICGFHDGTLIKLARECGFPRGLPTLWRPGQSWKTFGFYPKFDNDTRATPDDLKEFENVTAVTAFEKWSGFLSQLVVFKNPVTSEICWTVTSKNSADKNLIYVQEAKRIFTPFITPELLKVMVDRDLHLSAECISFQDQTHGAIVLSENVVVTAIGTGRTFALNTDGDKHGLAIPKPFCDFLTPLELVEFCTMYKLSCGSVYQTSDTKAFLTDLSKNRDEMTASLFQAIVRKHDVTVTPGTVRHQDILGEVQEGLVIRLTTGPASAAAKTEKQRTKKYKFVYYTIRPMMLRQKFPAATPLGQSPAPFTITADLPAEIERFVDAWCVSDAGKKKWSQWAMLAFLIRAKGKFPKHPLVADHIIVSEMTNNLFDPKVDYSKEFKQAISTTVKGTVVICVGPVGGGKSSMARLLVEQNPNAVHIDGDILDLDSETVLTLGQERNDYTIFQVIHALMQGKVPVISTGGGVLHDFRGNYILSDRIHKALGLNVEVILYIPEGDLDEVYSDSERVKKSVADRVARGEWKLPSKYPNVDAFGTFIAGLSSKNIKFAQSLQEFAAVKKTYPIITAENRDGVLTKLKAKPMETLAGSIGIANGTFNQIRLLMLVCNKKFSQVGHITVAFEPKGIKYSVEDFAALKAKYPDGKVSGDIVTATSSKDKKAKMSFAVPTELQTVIHKDGSTHVTLDSGPHAPVCCKSAALTLFEGKKEVTLPNKQGSGSKTYDTFKREPCEMIVLGAFGI